MASLQERLTDKYMPEPNSGCWIWLAAAARGYGLIKVGGRFRPAHRVSYVLECGEIADGEVLDHLCRNTYCVNPHHLEPVTIGENIRRGANHNAVKTHCKRGHEFTSDNTLTLATGSRACRECARQRMAAYMEKSNAS